LEEGLAWEEIKGLHEYFKTKKLKDVKKRRRMMKYIRVKNLFTTSKCYMFFHFLQNVLFWTTAIVFPLISVIGCEGGHKWMSHVAMALYLAIFLFFDFVFAGQYFDKESSKYTLRGKCCYMLGVMI
jgi:sterol desaturase/sphingolipid hydroxylase (fatty acid hydroxylase superfamily)